MQAIWPRNLKFDDHAMYENFVRQWDNALRDLSDHQIAAAFKKARNTLEYPPTIAKFRFLASECNCMPELDKCSICGSEGRAIDIGGENKVLCFKHYTQRYEDTTQMPVKALADLYDLTNAYDVSRYVHAREGYEIAELHYLGKPVNERVIAQKYKKLLDKLLVKVVDK
jgi:hypothetical protein